MDRDGPAEGDTSDVRGGWLHKMSDWKKTWNLRYFTLLYGTTLCYRETQESQDKAVAILKEVGEGTPAEPNVRSDCDGCEFWISTVEGTVWKLKADSSAARAAWVRSIQKGLHSLKQEDVIQPLEGVVSKRMAWTYAWQSRYFRIRGLDCSYSKDQKGEVKKRFLLLAWDPCPEENEVLVRTTPGEEFRLRFSNVAQCSHWTHTVRACLRRFFPNRWEVIKCKNHSLVEAQLSTTHHCGQLLMDRTKLLLVGGTPALESGVLPSFSNSGNTAGGADAGNPFLSSSSSKQGVLPPPKPPVGTKDLVVIDLQAEHQATLACVKAFDLPSKQGGTTRPRPRSRAAGALIRGQFFLHGGSRQFGDASDTVIFSDLWKLALDKPRELAWVPLDSETLPALTGHKMVALDDGQQLLISGGFDERYAVSNKCFLYTPSTNGVISSSCLPSGRAGHASVLLESGEVMVIGGHTKFDGSSESVVKDSEMILLYSLLADSWIIPPLTQPIVPLVEPCATTYGPEVFVFGGYSSAKQPKLYSFIMVSDTVVISELLCCGAIPRAFRGLSLHAAEDFLYLAGNCGVDDTVSQPTPLSPSGSPAGYQPATGLYRMLIPMSPPQQRDTGIGSGGDADDALALRHSAQGKGLHPARRHIPGESTEGSEMYVVHERAQSTEREEI